MKKEKTSIWKTERKKSKIERRELRKQEELNKTYLGFI
jgi:hypothetical protein